MNAAMLHNAGAGGGSHARDELEAVLRLSGYAVALAAAGSQVHGARRAAPRGRLAITHLTPRMKTLACPCHLGRRHGVD